MKKITLAIEYDRIESGFKGMGENKTSEGICFTVAVPQNISASLLLYEKGKEEIAAELPFPKERLTGNLAGLLVKNLNEKRFEYNYRIGDDVVVDPYAKCVRGPKTFGEEIEGEHTVRSGFLREKYDWQNDKKPEIPYEDAIMYNLHVRGFTKQKNSGVYHKGTFLGLQEKAGYLTELGINQIKLMPAYDFTELQVEDRRGDYTSAVSLQTKLNYWGYTGGHYFAPKRAYAATANPVKEFKDMVRTMHAQGIEVLMEFFFPPHMNPRMVTDCLQYWAMEYHIDGFHIIGDQELCNYMALDPLFAKTKLLNIYFPTNQLYGDHEQPSFVNVAECNDGFLIDTRRFLKGDEDCLRDFTERMRRRPAKSGLINYMTSHDGYTMQDLVSYEERHNEANGEHNRDGRTQNYSWNCGEEGPTRKRKILDVRKRQMMNAFSMLLLSSATPMLLQGDEFGNSQDGNNNPYCLDDETTWVDWKKYKSGKNELYQFVKDLIAFRKEHPILHPKKELTMMDMLSCGFPDISYHGNRAWYGDFDVSNRQIGMMYCGKYAGEDCFIYIAYNMHWMEHEFALPHITKEYQWYVAMETSQGVYAKEEQKIWENSRLLTAGPRTVKVLIGRK